MILILLTFFSLTLASLSQQVAPLMFTAPGQSIIVQGTPATGETKSDALLFWAETNYSLSVFGNQWTFLVTNDNIISATTTTPTLADIDSGGIVTYQAPGYAKFGLVAGNLLNERQFGYSIKRYMTTTNNSSVYRSFLSNQPTTLSWNVWTNMIARTNGNTDTIWQTRPTTIATRSNFVRNPNCFLNGIANLTAISQLQNAIGDQGNAPPFTALTRRHAYTRGHGTGVELGETAITNMECAGKNVVFVGAANEIVTMTCGERISTWNSPVIGGDFTIVIFDSDLPESITPMKVMSPTNLSYGLVGTPARYPSLATNYIGSPYIPIRTEQEGHLDTSVTEYTSGLIYNYLGPNFSYPNWKAGDSGSPDMLLIGLDLAMYGGRSTTAPSYSKVQQAMDQLSINAGLDPATNQLQYVDLSSYPIYPPQPP